MNIIYNTSKLDDDANKNLIVCRLRVANSKNG